MQKEILVKMIVDAFSQSQVFWESNNKTGKFCFSTAYKPKMFALRQKIGTRIQDRTMFDSVT